MIDWREQFDEMFEQNMEDISFYSEKAKVTAVDEGAGTCTVTLAADDAEITGVAFKTSKDNAEGIFITPTVGTYVMVSWLNNEVCFVSLVQDYDKVTIKKGGISIVMDGSNVVVNGGVKTVALAPDVSDRLNLIEENINTLKAIIQSWIPVPNDGGAKLKADLTAWHTGDDLAPTSEGDIDSANFKG